MDYLKKNSWKCLNEHYLFRIHNSQQKNCKRTVCTCKNGKHGIIERWIESYGNQENRERERERERERASGRTVYYDWEKWKFDHCICTQVLYIY